MKSFKPRGPQPPRDIDPPDPPARKKQEPKPAGDWKGRGKSYKNDTHFSPTDPAERNTALEMLDEVLETKDQ